MKQRGKGALAGVHMFWAGDHIRWFSPVHEGDRIWVPLTVTKEASAGHFQMARLSPQYFHSGLFRMS